MFEKHLKETNDLVDQYLKKALENLKEDHLMELSDKTEGFSIDDICVLLKKLADNIPEHLIYSDCSDSIMNIIRIMLKDFKPSVKKEVLDVFEEFNEKFKR